MSKIEDLTPAHIRCAIGASCPSIHRLEDGGLLIVGEAAGTDANAHGVSWGDGELAILISPNLLADLKAEWVREAIEALDLERNRQ